MGMSNDDRCVNCRGKLDYPNVQFCSKCSGDIKRLSTNRNISWGPTSAPMVVVGNKTPYITVYDRSIEPVKATLVRIRECPTCGASLGGLTKCPYCGNEYLPEYSIQTGDCT